MSPNKRITGSETAVHINYVYTKTQILDDSDEHVVSTRDSKNPLQEKAENHSSYL